MTDPQVRELVRSGLGPDAVARLAALRRRLWRRRALVLAAPAALVGLTLAAIALLIGRTIAIEQLPLVLASIAVLTLVGWAVAAWLRRPSLAETARRADMELGLRERLGTAIELLSQGADDPMEHRQLDDARTTLAAAPVTHAFPATPPRRLLGAGVVALGLIAILTIWPNPQDNVLNERKAIRDASRSVAERIEELADEAEATGAETQDPRRDELVEELRELARQLREQGEDREATLARIGSVQESLDRMRDPQASALDAALTQLARATSRAATGEEAANPEGSGEEAAADLERLADELGQMSEGEARERAEALRAAAESAASGQAEIAAQLTEAAEAIERAAESGSEADQAAAEQALERAAEAFRGAEQDRQLQRDVARAQSALSDGSRQVARAGDPSPGSSGQPGTGTANNPGQPGTSGAPGGGNNPGSSGQPGQPGASGQPGQPGSSGQPGQPGASGAPGSGTGNQPGSGTGNQPGSGPGTGNGNQPGSGTGTGGGGGTTARRIPGGGLRTGGFDGPTQGNKGFSVDGSDGVFTDFDRLGEPGDPDFIAGQGGDGGSEQTGSGNGVGFDNDSVVPYSSVYGLFRDFANNQLDSTDVPVTLKDFVRDYFSRLEPTQ